MYPVLLQLGPLTIHTYGFMVALGFISVVAVLRRLAPREGMNGDTVADLVFWCLLVGMLGARVLYFITQPEILARDPLAFFKLWEGGLVFFGGPLLAIPFLVFYTKKKGLPIWLTLDLMAVGTALAHMFGRLGCFGAGCCYGKLIESIFGVKFYSPLVDQAFRGIPLHPTQLYEATSVFILFLGLVWVLRNRKFDGQAALTYLIAYPVIRAIIEEFRGDLDRGTVLGGMLSTSQGISILVLVAAVGTWIYRVNAGARNTKKQSHKQSRA